MSKVRQGFVANSSSASFIIARKHFNDTQLHLLEMHQYLAGFDTWHVRVDEDTVSFSTSMTNFDIKGYLYAIGVDYKKVADKKDFSESDAE